MLDHLGVNVPDLAAARRYYDVIMPLLGFEPFFSADRQFSYQRKEGKPGTTIFFYLATEESSYSRRRAGLQHLAFKVRTRAEVDAVHAKVVELGNEIVRGPGVFPQYHENYYAVFWHDPHGFMLEAVCHRANEQGSGI
jgi:catechol 2,3-dioxygenase-like lactoylglutathione lyase family enzyme